MQWQGGVHNLRMRREKMDGVNLREGIMEVAFEQWTERTYYTAAEHWSISADTGTADVRQYK